MGGEADSTIAGEGAAGAQPNLQQGELPQFGHPPRADLHPGQYVACWQGQEELLQGSLWWPVGLPGWPGPVTGWDGEQGPWPRPAQPTRRIHPRPRIPRLDRWAHPEQRGPRTPNGPGPRGFPAQPPTVFPSPARNLPFPAVQFIVLQPPPMPLPLTPPLALPPPMVLPPPLILPLLLWPLARAPRRPRCGHPRDGRQ
ncbi:cleavage and polyadenylation specificity factor subunit 6-like [Ornithorhynchus anatinus]|uniref:cleavage and polyadenylation specificity factor subunit 6-like n=1 Tax=Ornithorhynchus anatinus TaxID=9258 RepID=UPI000454973D|nr:cleavage and polyadenylation specificity factor subunit 6-like [Ornithorhynchus anatinus]